jgi:hypothetical protein
MGLCEDGRVGGRAHGVEGERVDDEHDAFREPQRAQHFEAVALLVVLTGVVVQIQQFASPCLDVEGERPQRFGQRLRHRGDTGGPDDLQHPADFRAPVLVAVLDAAGLRRGLEIGHGREHEHGLARRGARHDRHVERRRGERAHGQRVVAVIAVRGEL